MDHDNISNPAEIITTPFAQASQNISFNVTNQTSILFEYPVETEDPLILAEYVPVSQTNCTLEHADCYIFQTYTYSSALSLAAISVFLRIGFLLKLGLMVITVASHFYVYHTLNFFKGMIIP